MRAPHDCRCRRPFGPNSCRLPVRRWAQAAVPYATWAGATGLRALPRQRRIGLSAPHEVVWGECDRISSNKIQEGSSPIIHEPGQRRGTKSVRKFSLLNAVCSDAPMAGAKTLQPKRRTKSPRGASNYLLPSPLRRAVKELQAPSQQGRNRFLSLTPSPRAPLPCQPWPQPTRTSTHLLVPPVPQ